MAGLFGLVIFASMTLHVISCAVKLLLDTVLPIALFVGVIACLLMIIGSWGLLIIKF